MTTPSVILGLAIGDALGQPFEFSNSKQISDTKWKGDFTYGNLWKLKAGSWTDDTKMALCIARCLAEQPDFDVNVVAQGYVDWVKSGDLRGIGNTCERSISNLFQGMSPLESGKKEKARAKPSFSRVGRSFDDASDVCGNGIVMRVAPIAVRYRKNPNKAFEMARLDANITHDHPDARDASVALTDLLIRLLNGEERTDAFVEVMNAAHYEWDHVPKAIRNAYNLLLETEPSWEDCILLGTSGTAHQSIATAMFCFVNYDSFEEAVVNSIRVGGDTDSRGAIVGAMAGAYYGLEGIPESYVKQVEDSEILQELDKTIYDLS
jgi:ADP-ribosyl-[dinitrogen reductase] hydrolase